MRLRSISTLSRRLVAGGLLSAALAAPALAANDKPQDFQLDYEVWKSGFEVLRAKIDFETSPALDRYKMELEADLVGAPALLFSYHLDLLAEGRLSQRGVEPLTYRSETLQGKREKKREWLQMAYNAQGIPAVSGDPLPADEAREQLPAFQLRDSADPMSAIVETLFELGATGSCENVAKVFDGRRRYDLVSKGVGDTDLSKSSINIYSGPAQICELSVKQIGGYRHSGTDKKNFARKIKVYMASPAPNLPVVPVRIVAETGWGTVLIHLVKVTDRLS